MTWNNKSSELKLTKILHYGAQVSISLSEGTDKGFIFGDGFVTKTISYKKESSFETEDFTGAVFKIMQAFNCSAQKNLQTVIINQYSQAINTGKNEIQDLIDEADLEMDQNLENYQKIKKKPVVFGTPIQLYHTKSQKFLAFRSIDKESSLSAGQYSFRLVDDPSEDTLFKIMPSYKFQFENNRYVKFGDHILLQSGSEIVHRNHHLYIETLSNLTSSDIKTKANGVENNLEDNIIISLDKSSKLCFSLFSEAVEQEESTVAFSDIIWLQHIEQNNYLIFENKRDATQIVNKGQLQAGYKPYDYGIYFKKCNPRTGRDSNGMWKIESVDKVKADAFSWGATFRLRHISTGLYLTLKRQENSELVHIALTKVLSQNSIFKLVKADSLGEERERLQKSNGNISVDNFVRICHSTTGLWLSASSLASSTEALGDQAANSTASLMIAVPIASQTFKQDDVFKILKASQAEVWETYILISCQPVLKNAHLLFANMYATREQNGYFSLLDGARESGLSLIKDSLVSIISFVYESNAESFSVGAPSKANESRQKMLKEQGFVKILAILLDGCFPDQKSLENLQILHDDEVARKNQPKGNKQISKRSIWKEFQNTYMVDYNKELSPAKIRNMTKTLSYLYQIGCLSYELIKAICKDNRQNEVECFLYMDIFKRQAGYGLGVVECIISIFKDNEMLLYSLYSSQNFLRSNNLMEDDWNFKTPLRSAHAAKTTNITENSSLIYFFINQLKTASHRFQKDILKFLSAACKFEDQGITTNQNFIHNKLFENKQLRGIAFLEITCTDDKIHFKIPAADLNKTREELICLDDASRSAGRFDKYISYLTEQLELFSNLCFGRQYVCRQTILPILPISALKKNIWKMQLSKGIRAALIMVLYNVYINTNPHTELIVPEMARTLSNSSQKVTPFEIVHPNKKNAANKQKSSIRLNESSSNLLNASLFTEIDEHEKAGYLESQILNELKVDIISYLNKDVYTDHKIPCKFGSKTVEFDSFLYNLAATAHKMALFGIYSNTIFTNLIPSENMPEVTSFFRFKTKDKGVQRSELAQLINVLFPILMIETEGRKEDQKPVLAQAEASASVNLEAEADGRNSGSAESYSAEKIAKMMHDKSLELDKQNNNQQAENTKSKQAIEARIAQESLRKAAATFVSVHHTADAFETSVRKEILSIINFAQDLRLNYLITNALDYFSKKVMPLEGSLDYDASLIRIVERGGYLPLIMNSHVPSSYNDKPDLIKDEARFYEDVDKMTGSYFLKYLIYLFAKSKDYELETLILNLMFKCFSQRSTLIKSLRNVQIVFSEDEVSLFEFCKRRVSELKEKADMSEIWFLGSKKCFKTIDLVNSIMQDLIAYFYTSTSMNKVTNKLVVLPDGMQDNQISHTRQGLLHSIELHKILMMLLKDGTYILEEFLDESDIDTADNRKIITLFRNCYNVLILMCKNDNKEAKKSLLKFMNIFSMQLPLLQVGQSELICEIYKYSKISPIILDELVSTFYKNIANKGHNPSYLSFFETILEETNHEVLQDNIGRIITILNDDTRKHNFLFMYYNEKRRQYEFNLSLDRRIDGDYPFIYQQKVLEILITMLEKSANRIIVKLVVQNLIPVNAVLRILSKNDCFSTRESNFKTEKALPYSIIKITATKFFYKFWLEGDRITASLLGNKLLLSIIDKEARKMETITPKEILELTQRKKQKQKTELARHTLSQLELFSIKRINENEESSDLTKSRSQTKSRIVINTSDFTSFVYNYYIYFLVYLIPVMSKLNEMFTSPELGAAGSRSLDLVTLLGFSTIFKSNYYKFEKILNQNYKFKNNIEEFIGLFAIEPEDLAEVEDKFDYSQIVVNFEDNDLAEPGMLKDYFKKSINQNDAILIDSSLKNHTFIDKNDDEGKQRLWKSFVLNMSSNDTVRKLVQKERRALLQTLLNIDTLELEGSKLQLITLESFIRKVIVYIQTSTENLIDNEDQKESLYGSIMLLTDLLAACSNANELKQMQSLLFRCQAVRIACNVLFKKDMPQETQKLMVYFCTKMLDGGNTEVQNGFYSVFISDPNSENFFSFTYEFITAEISRNKKRITSSQKVEMCVQTWDYVDKLFRFDLSMPLRLLQLLAENHNSDLQAYMREQSNSKNNYNMVSLVVRLAETLIENLTQENYQLLLQCLDTLSEFIQGPCYENQIALANSRFIEMSSQVLKKDIETRKPKNSSTDYTNLPPKTRDNALKPVTHPFEKTDKRSDLIEEAISNYYRDISETIGDKIKDDLEKNDTKEVRSWMLSRIKFKTLITLESILEGRSDQIILKKTIKTLPIGTLKENLLTIYKNFIGLYGKGENYTSKALNHAELDPDNPKVSTKELDLIIEIGFSAYKLMRLYLEYVPAFDDDEETIISLEELRHEFNQIIRSYASNSVMVERIGPKIPEITAASMLRGKTKRKTEQEDQTTRRFFEHGLLFFHKHTGHIDILREDRLFKTYVMILPHCTHLTPNMQKQFHKNINRMSVKSKVSGLLEMSDDIIQVMKHEEKIQRLFDANIFTKVIMYDINFYKNLAFLLNLLQNFLIIFSNTLTYYGPITPQSLSGNETITPISARMLDDDGTKAPFCDVSGRTYVYFEFLDKNATQDTSCWCDEDYVGTCNNPTTITLMQGLGMAQTTAAFMVLSFFLIKTCPIVWQRAMKRQHEIEMSYSLNLLGLKKVSTIIAKYLLGVYNVFSDPYLSYHFIYYLFSLIGLYFVSNPKTYAISNFFNMALLFDLVYRAPLLQHIVSAIWRPKRAIALALVLFVILQYGFTLIAYNYFSQDFRGQCDTLLTCLMIAIDNTFKSDGGVGGYLQGLDGPPNFQKNPTALKINQGRFAFDNINNFILVILIVQIISGIIIDTFAVLREEDEERHDDMLNNCFICGFDRQTLDKKSDNRKGFAYHVKFDHNLWNYLFYIAYVKNKEKTEYTGMESFIAEQIENGEIDWFPIQRTEENTEMEEGEDDSNSRALKGLENSVDGIKDNVHRIDEKIEVVKQLITNKEDNTPFDG